MSRRSGTGHAMRGVRGVLLAGCSATLSVTAHLLGGGQVPHLLTTVATSVLIAWVATAVAEHTRGVGGVVVVLGGAQAATHLALGELSGHSVGGTAMLAGHVGATLVTAALLSHAEAMLAVAASTLSALRVLITDTPRPAAQRRCGGVVRAAEGVLPFSVHLRRAHPRRGPPTLS